MMATVLRRITSLKQLGLPVALDFHGFKQAHEQKQFGEYSQRHASHCLLLCSMPDAKMLSHAPSAMTRSKAHADAANQPRFCRSGAL